MTVIVAFKHKLSDKFSTRIKQQIIQKWTNSKYYHVEIIIENEWIEADNGKGLVRHRLRPLSDKYDYVKIEVPECEHTKRLVDTFINSQMGAEYDWVGIYLSQVIKLGIDKGDRWFCSEFVVKVLQILNIESLIYVKPENMSPGKLFRTIINTGSGHILSNYDIENINDIISNA